jgi:lysophospholipase
MSFLLAILLSFFVSGELLPAQIFLQTATSTTVPHPLQPQLHNHYYVVNAGQPVAIVFLPGMGEASLKYHDLYESLHLKNYTYYGWDHIGQGFSSHLLPEELIKVHIDSFETHTAAVQAFLKTLRSRHRQVIVLGHSMGAHVALRVAAESPELIDALILSAPLFDINPTIRVGAVLSWILSLFPDSAYPPLYSFFVKNNIKNGWVTNSVERQAEFQKTLTLFPTLKRQGATIGWLRAARESVDKLKKINFKTIHAPVLLLQAETDYLVDNSAQDKGCEQLPLCKKEVMKNSKHEILFEVDAVRTLALEKIRLFITSLNETSKAVNL